jgi:hypothetical protein
VPQVPDYPSDLHHPLTRGEAALLGIGWRELEGGLWRSPFRGVHVWSATDPVEPLQRAYDAAALLPPAGALGGWAACQVGGARELDGRGPSGREAQPVLACLPRELRVRRGPSIRPFRSHLDDSDVTEVCGVRLTRPLRTAFDLARTEPLVQAVVAVDYLSRGRPDFLADLLTYSQDHSALNGAHHALAAVRRATPRSRSSGETRLRLLWALDAGLPEPVVNPSVRLLDGFLLGMPDLLDPEIGYAGEYDGAGHRDPDQHARDNVREEGFEGGGLVVVRFGSIDLGPARRRSVARLEAGRRRAVEAARSPRLWTWEEGPLPDPTPHW